MGKTTLVKKIISDWLSKKDDIKGLNDFAILLNVECRDSIESFKDLWIAQRFKLFDEDTEIADHTIDAYIALLRATNPPLPNREEIKIVIALHDTDGCITYEGIWDPTFQIPQNIGSLLVRFKDHPSLDAFCQSLEKTKQIEFLLIRFSVNDVSSVSRPIPFLEKDPLVYVYVRDVKEEDIEKVGDILRTLQPQDARRSFWAIEFPLCSLGRTRSPEVILRLLASLKGVRVRGSIGFPKEERPNDEALLEEMHLKAKESTGCDDGVECLFLNDVVYLARQVGLKLIKMAGKEEEEEREKEEKGEEEDVHQS
ncbi:uncharacterized protein [Palaemon carinicauda]|uniref:uncharacterized protein n=1 Tax=Palaemon carinicauda TaxID=392227 RepID=UPI0035B5790C